MAHTHIHRRARQSRRAFTLIEVLVATALLGFSLIVMFGFHAQAVRSNREARKVTDCTYLAQRQAEELLSIEWTRTGGRASGSLASGTTGASDWGYLYHPAGGGAPTPVNAMGEVLGSETARQPAATYYITWEVDEMDPTNDSWIRLRVRCAWEDRAFGNWNGTTISTYRYRDD